MDTPTSLQLHHFLVQKYICHHHLIHLGKMSKFAPLDLPSQDSDATFPGTYSRVEHLGRQPPPKQSVMIILGRETEEPYVTRIPQEACLRVYNENHAIGQFLLDLANALDQSSGEIARGHEVYEQEELKWREPEPLGFLAWAVARPRHLIAKYKLLKLELEAILMDCEMETYSPGHEPSTSRYFQMLSSEPTREFLVELKAWTANMKAFIVEASRREKLSADLSRLRQVCPGG